MCQRENRIVLGVVWPGFCLFLFPLLSKCISKCSHSFCLNLFLGFIPTNILRCVNEFPEQIR